MKKILPCLCMIAFALTSYGKTIDEQTARTVAYNFYKPKANLLGLSDLSLVYTATSVLNNATVVDFYIFNAVSIKGFVIVSADDIVLPILGYSTESGFNANKINSSVQYWLGIYEKQIAYEIQVDASPSAQIAAKWTNLKTGASATRVARTTSTDTVAVPIMLPTKWDQENPYSTALTYNADCPYDSHAATPGMTITGCVATAMAQVMKYWNWPDTGIGSNTYTQSPNPDGIPAQTANFAIAYHFDSMQTPSLTRANAYVAKLMYNAGVSVDMNYGTDAEDGSGAYVTVASAPGGVTSAESALDNNWRYPSAKGYQRTRHTVEANWVDSMLNEMDAARPVIYGGQGSAGGHCWVMDGFDPDSFFHFNWGWTGAYDGYFTVNNLNPDPGDTFNDEQEAIIRIIPDTPAGYSADTATKVVSSVTTITTHVNDILIFPNPAANAISVSFEGVLVNEIIITDIEGRTMQQLSTVGNASSITLSVEDLPDGIYLLRLQTDLGILTRKFVVAK